MGRGNDRQQHNFVFLELKKGFWIQSSKNLKHYCEEYIFNSVAMGKLIDRVWRNYDQILLYMDHFVNIF